MKRDGYKDKYTNPRRAEATTDEYLVEIQTIKNTRDKRPKRLHETNMTQAIPLAETSNKVKCEKCGLTFKAKGIKRHQTVKHKTANHK
jgi:hypothetical protein